jgi:hypothetical protein
MQGCDIQSVLVLGVCNKLLGAVEYTVGGGGAAECIFGGCRSLLRGL